ncbi:MAG TPA: BMP family ABC transporter substrate-binding protein [Candidatus Sulfomarinibacteraceae bacterium]|nr:BMP family ABC transporter substrate-binding protein [Candidatus Sulfomarinibacteraceae bacterium]
MRKTIVLLTLLLALALVACGGDQPAEPGASPGEEPTAAVDMEEETPSEPEEEPAADDDCASDEVFCVGLVTDVGRVDDKSFNQSAWEGVRRAADELDAQIDFVETDDATDYANNIGLFAESNYDVVVTVGFALGEATLEAAQQYPDIDFIGVDQFIAPEAPDGWEGDWPPSNVTGLIFPEDQSGFLAGALAGLLTESNTIAAVLGTDLVPPVVAFKEGYENGAEYVNEDVQIISTYHPGGLDIAFTDPGWGADTARQAIQQGADVIFGAGGNTGNGALIETASHAGVYCIGVDTDQWETVPEAHPCLVTSAMKLITPGVFDLVQASHDGNLPAGNFLGEAGLAPFHDFDDEIPQEIKDRLDEINAGLEAGEIDTGYSP